TCVATLADSDSPVPSIWCISSPLVCLLASSTGTSTTHPSTLSLHDALPIYHLRAGCNARRRQSRAEQHHQAVLRHGRGADAAHRSEEHTSELQSHLNLVCRLLLEKKKSRATIKHAKVLQQDIQRNDELRTRH